MFWFSDKLALKASKARPVDQSEAPELYRDIEEIAGRAGVPMPRVYLIPSEQPNAFATGRSPKKAVGRGHRGPAPLPAARPGEGACSRTRWRTSPTATSS